MLWVEDIVESTPTPPFWTNSKVDMVRFVYLHKVVARTSAWNGGEWKGEVGRGRLKCQNKKNHEKKKKKRENQRLT